ncbi:multidrug efflux RND transporter permease subunit [Vibrio natriegens]|uniref:efflux RND transporter permease subunit n=1 Tax=Vibrio natriegens TaxID=691 RepID=UPI000803E7FF|nr:efflux RND transporter permease subunit [Vibrio natriegens]ANQ25152.1 multidrug efflux RND transporter permease subunit [Vibrio natriegens]
MFSTIFISRPVFAWVVALFILIAGVTSITQLPIAQYPNVAPPSVVITTSYPGASAQVLDENVLSVIQEQLNGIEGMIYMASQADSNGTGTITATFENGTDISSAQIDVQNRLSRVTSRLPSVVVQQGIRVDKSRSSTLLVVSLSSSNDSVSPEALGDYASRNILPELLRIKGVGQATLFGSEQAMRIWLDPDKMTAYGLSSADISEAIRAQNLQISAGSIGALPNPDEQKFFAPVIASGQLQSVSEFNNIVLHANTDGSRLRLADVARVDTGAQNYSQTTRLNSQSALGINVQLSPSGNALETSQLIYEKMDELQRYFPSGVSYSIPYDTSGFVKVSIAEVVKTLFEAVVLVFLVMLLFLQNIRYTIIPTIVVPVSLLGTFGVMLVLGYSINMLTLFGMVLAIGILVDDAIIVVENVERIMREEQLSPIDATKKAMHQISGAVIGISAVLVSVFLPMAMFGGTVGNIYRQFSVSMVSCMLFSAFLALSLTPALCSTLLKPHDEMENKKGFLGWFNRNFNKGARHYESLVSRILNRLGRYLFIYLGICIAMVLIYRSLPTSFLPAEDKGYVLVNMQLPPGATQSRSKTIMQELESYVLKQPETASIFTVMGNSFSGAGQNAGLAFVPLKDWSEREGEQHSAHSVAGRIIGAMGHIRDAVIYALNPPPISGLGRTNGFSFQLQDRVGVGHEALLNARNELLKLASQSSVLRNVRPNGLEDAPQLQIDINRQKAATLGVSFSDIAAVLSTNLGSQYVNDFINQGRLQRVIVQAQDSARMQPNDILTLRVKNRFDELVPLSSFMDVHWETGPIMLSRYNGYPSMSITGEAASGFSSGEAMAEMEGFMSQLPSGVGFEWSDQSREEKLSGSQIYLLLMFSVVAVFLCLAALYNSWSIPLAVMLIVPVGIIGAVGAIWICNMSNDVYFKVGLITIIGLSAKNAILIIEFARELQQQGKGLIEATIEACHLRFRPIIMTSMAFIIGVIPLALATGAGSGSQRAIGISVLGGMITATVLAVFLIPVLFVFISRLTQRKNKNSVKLTLQEKTSD